jgi:hypothetical protein
MRSLGQNMASLRSSAAPYKSAFTQGGKKLIQVRLRDTLAVGDLYGLNGTPAIPLSKVNQRSDSVVYLIGTFMPPPPLGVRSGIIAPPLYTFKSRRYHR